jgi:transcriptional regulator with XRE-family HTH domain
MARDQRALGERIKEARTLKRWKQKQLAAAVSVEPITVSRWETGRHAPDLDMIDLIAEALGQPVSYFLGGPMNGTAATVPDGAETSALLAMAAEMAELRREVAAVRALNERLLALVEATLNPAV